MVISSLFLAEINSSRYGGYPYFLFPSIMNYNIASCTIIMSIKRGVIPGMSGT